MISLKPYPQYKDSDVAWLGLIPENWTITRNKSYLKYRKDTVGDDSENYTLLSLTLKGIIKRDMDNPQGKFPAEFNTYKIVNQGDLIFCLFDIDETPRTVGLSSYDGMITGAYDILYSDNQKVIDYLYLYYLAIDNIKGLRPLYSGLRKVVPKDVFMSMKIALPSENEQVLIVRYLNYTNSRITRFVVAKKKLIKLLEEQKQAIIYQAVIGAIDVRTGKPYLKYKDTGDELVRVPWGWNSSKIKYVCSIHNGSDHKSIETDAGYPVIGSGGQFSYASRFIYDKESVLFGRKGTIDKPLYMEQPFWTVDTMFYTKIYKKIFPKYLYYIAKTIPYQFYSTHTALPSMTQTILGNFRIGLPSIESQKSIVDFIGQELFVIDQTIDHAKKEIDLLKEYRTRLTADVVTGKVDVREVAKNLPDELKTITELDEEEFGDTADGQLEQENEEI